MRAVEKHVRAFLAQETPHQQFCFVLFGIILHLLMTLKVVNQTLLVQNSESPELAPHRTGKLGNMGYLGFRVS